MPLIFQARPLFFAIAIYSAPALSGAEFDHLSPHQRAILESKSPAPEEYRFGFDLPAGPQFTDAEKEEQRARGSERGAAR